MTAEGWVAVLIVLLTALLYVLWSVKPRRHAHPRRRGRIAVHRFAGLAWPENRIGYWGPCCDSCLKQYALRPAHRTSEGIQHYELVCPACGQSTLGQTITLQGLLSLDAEVARYLHRQRRRPLAAVAPGELLTPS